MDDLQKYSDKAMELLMNNGPTLLLAIAVIIIGFLLIKLFTKSLGKAMTRSKIDVSLQRFLLSLIGILLKVILLISAISMIGVEMTPFIAVLGAAGLAIGLSLQSSLGNFACGILILLFKPYKVGDFVEAADNSGTVHEIQIFSTILKTPDNKTVIIPNGEIYNNSITNYSTEPKRRVDMTFGCGYSDNLKKAKEILETITKNDTRVLKDPAPMVAVSELADSSVNFVVRAWCNTPDYWNRPGLSNSSMGELPEWNRIHRICNIKGKIKISGFSACNRASLAWPLPAD